MLHAGCCTLDLHKRQVRGTVVDTTREFYQASIYFPDLLRPCKRYIAH